MLFICSLFAIKSFISTFSIWDIWRSVSKLGWERLQTYKLTELKLLSNFFASQICEIPFSSRTSFIWFDFIFITLNYLQIYTFFLSMPCLCLKRIQHLRFFIFSGAKWQLLYIYRIRREYNGRWGYRRGASEWLGILILLLVVADQNDLFTSRISDR